MTLVAGEVLIVSGPPGSGKTTVAAALADETPRAVYLESDWFYHAIRTGFVAPHLPAARAQNIIVMDVAADAAAGFATAGYAVVWDGIVGPWFLDQVVRRLAQRQVRVRYLVLRPSRERALDRVRRRDGTAEVSGAAIMFDQLADLGPLEPHVVNSDDGLDDVLDRCRAALSDDRLVIGPEVWVDDHWPVSVKGVLGWDGRYVVLRNRRGEWELPGGRLDATDTGPVEALQREMSEELGLDVTVAEALDSWVYRVEDKQVLIVTYRCEAVEPDELRHSDEHTHVAALDIDTLSDPNLAGAPIPSGYLNSIRSVDHNRRNHQATPRSVKSP